LTFRRAIGRAPLPVVALTRGDRQSLCCLR
jgi:hypothetical protein